MAYIIDGPLPIGFCTSEIYRISYGGRLEDGSIEFNWEVESDNESTRRKSQSYLGTATVWIVNLLYVYIYIYIYMYTFVVY